MSFKLSLILTLFLLEFLVFFFFLGGGVLKALQDLLSTRNSKSFLADKN